MTPKRSPPRITAVSNLVALLQVVNGGIIALDGCLNGGKTTLMKELGVRLSCRSIDFDDYVARGQGRYVAALRRNDLDAAIERALALSKVAVLAGVCMRAVLEQIGRRAAFNVYVQRDALLGPPYDYEILDLEDEPMAEDSEEDEIDVEAPGAVCREVARYPRAIARVATRTSYTRGLIEVPKGGKTSAMPDT
ncbi:hypothetical protein P0D72_40165 [Paraburkholderia sediminicola]|uniref:hypothetical protein n=1 Tax=Paraburkholderia sediminicola TaxID=458836 RepID=UPI0038BAC38E